MNSGQIELQLQSMSRRLGWVPYFVLLIALAGTIMGSWFVAETGAEKDQTRFANEVQSTSNRIADRVATYENLLRGAAGLVAARPDLSAEEFQDYVDRLDLPRLYPGIQGIGYSVRVRREEVAELEESMAATFPGFHVWPPTDGQYVHLIKYLEPLDRRNREALGYNMFSQPTRRAAMERARDTGTAAASGVVKLVQEIDEDIQPGFLVYLPLYDSDELPSSLETRRALLSGFVYSPFRADDLLENVFDPLPPAVAFRVFDGSRANADRLLHQSPSWVRAISSPGRRYLTTTHLRVAGRIWTVEVASLPGFSQSNSQINARWIAVIGILLSLVLFALTRSQTSARVSAERALNNLRKSEKELRQSETRVRRLVEANIIGIVLGRRDGTIVEANDAFLSMLGIERPALIKSPLSLEALSAEPSADLSRYALDELERQGRFGPYEHIFLRPDHTQAPALMGMASVEGPSHDWVGFVLDLSERKHMEVQLIEQKETLETLNRVQQVVSAELEVSKVLEAVTQAATTLAAADSASFFYRDPAAGSDFSYSGPKTRSSNAAAATTRDHPIVQRAFSDITAEPEQQTDPEGEGVLAVPVVSRFGTVVGALVVTRRAGGTFSERTRNAVSGLAAQTAVAIDNAMIYAEAQRDRRRAEEANVAKDQFLANLSHELRTPMTAIVGWVRMLQLGELDDQEYREAIEAISRSAKSQAQLVEDILDVSRIATGKMKIEKRPIDLVEVVEASIDSVWPSIEAKGIDLISIVPENPIRIEGDPQRLQQVVWNLLSNAVKFTNDGGKVSIEARQHDGLARIVIRDNGEGIDQSVLPHIFERFRQADGTTTRTYGGLGLGLSLVDYIVRAHGGSAAAESEGRGQGARFTIELPLMAQMELDQHGHDQSAPDRSSLAGVTVLLAEDDAEIRRMVSAILRHSGARVISARNAAQALEHLSNEPVDILVSDIAMPGEDGLALIRKVRSGARGRSSIPAAALTAYASDNDRNRILRAGYDIHLMKPLEPETLLNAILSLTRRMENQDAESD